MLTNVALRLYVDATITLNCLVILVKYIFKTKQKENIYNVFCYDLLWLKKKWLVNNTRSNFDNLKTKSFYIQKVDHLSLN